MRAHTIPRQRIFQIALIFLSLCAALTMCGRVVQRLERGKTQIATIQIKELEGALSLFRHDAGRYPTTGEGLSALVQNPRTLANWFGPYSPRAAIPNDAWGRPYNYQCPGRHGSYDLISYGADGLEGGTGENADITNWETKIPRQK